MVVRDYQHIGSISNRLTFWVRAFIMSLYFAPERALDIDGLSNTRRRTRWHDIVDSEFPKARIL